MQMYVDVDINDVLDEISTEDLIDELQSRKGYPIAYLPSGGVFIPVKSLADVQKAREVLDAAGIKYEVIK